MTFDHQCTSATAGEVLCVVGFKCLNHAVCYIRVLVSVCFIRMFGDVMLQ